VREGKTLNLTYLSGIIPFVMDDLERQAQRSKYFNDVALWAHDNLGLDLWYKQKEIADALATGTSKSIAVRAGHGVGKSFLAGIIVAWWVDTRPIQYCFVATTAPSADQVTSILWREIRHNYQLSHARYKEYLRLKERGEPTGNLPDHPLPGYITQDNKWKDDMGNIIAQGRKPPDHSEDAYQGIHAEYVLAIGDEACGLKENMIDSLSNITSNAKSRRLLIGNPTNPRSRFGDIFNDTTPREVEIDGKKVMRTLQEVWSLHHISVLDSPNFHGKDRCAPNCPRFEEHRLMPIGLGLYKQALESLTDMSYVIEKQGEYGVDSARYKARVEGEFAYDAGNNLFEDYDMAKARDAQCFVDYDTDITRTVLGVDVARSKDGDTSYVYRFTTGMMRALDDETGEPGAITQVHGGELRYVDSFRGVPLVDRFEINGTKTVGQATLIDQHARQLNAQEVRVDSGGMGVGLIDGLMALAWNQHTQTMAYRVIEMQGGGPTPDGRSWYNNRAFQYSQMRERFKRGEVDIDPADKVLIGQLEDILVEFVDPHAAMKIESKDSMKKRGVKSPDAADAAWYACADLTHLDGVQEGDTFRKSAADLLKERQRELVLSGFYDGSQF
jgi:hypothetical protein